MSDPRIAIVAGVLRDNGHNATGTGLTTDDLAAAIVGALVEHGNVDAPTAHQVDETGAPAGADAPPANPETPFGTGTEGGAGDPAS